MLAFSAIKNNDKVGLILFTDRIEKFVPPKKGRAHILRIIRELISFEPTGTGTSIRQALEYFNHVHKKRTIAFLISDFIDDGYDQILRIISRKHDVIAVEVSDPREETLPDSGLIKLRDAETGTRPVGGLPETTVSGLRSCTTGTSAARSGATCSSAARWTAIPIRIDRPYIKPIVDFFKMRERRL